MIEMRYKNVGCGKKIKVKISVEGAKDT